MQPESVLITELGNDEHDDHQQKKDIHHKVLFTESLIKHDGLRLPAAINGIALRESFLSEAPFILSSNRSFWRKMIDNQNFQEILCHTYYFISSCISETSVVDLIKLSEARQSEYIKDIPGTLAQLYLTISLKDRDIFLPRFPEVLSYLLIHAIRTTNSKLHRLLSMAQFREILLDWCTELLSGIRLTNCRFDMQYTVIT